MTIYYEEEGDVTLPLNCEELAKEVAEAALTYEKCPYEAQLNLLLTENHEIQQMNAQFRQIDRATDVLSFPMIEYTIPADFSKIEEDDSNFDLESGELILGDIVLSKEKVLAQAEEYGHSVKREFSFLIAHSMLHLLGYDHIKEEERQIMEEKQHAILKKLNILR